MSLQSAAARTCGLFSVHSNAPHSAPEGKAWGWLHPPGSRLVAGPGLRPRSPLFGQEASTECHALGTGWLLTAGGGVVCSLLVELVLSGGISGAVRSGLLPSICSGLLTPGPCLKLLRIGLEAKQVWQFSSRSTCHKSGRRLLSPVVLASHSRDCLWPGDMAGKDWPPAPVALSP